MRRLTSILCLIACVLGIWTATRAGLSRHYSSQGGALAQTASTVEALHLAPDDPVAHNTHAVGLAKAGQTSEAISYLKSATALRPQDYRLWSQLGRGLLQNGDEDEAVVAFREAVRCAEYYAQPRWDLGRLLLDMGRPDEAFAELRRAGASDPNLFSEVVNLAWKHFEGNAAAVAEATQPQTSEAQMRLARFFAWRGLPDDGMKLFRQAEEVSPRDKNEFISDLVAGKWFSQAYEVWSKGSGLNDQPPANIDDAGFESGAEAFNRAGFGWTLPREIGALRISFEKFEPRAGDLSLRLEWRGVTYAAVPLLSQLVIVEPAARYRLSYAARTTELVSGTPPFIGVLDAARDDANLLARSELLTGTTPWQDYAFDFSTLGETRAIRVVVQRPKCNEGLCPIFGRLWLDSFSLTKL